MNVYFGLLAALCTFWCMWCIALSNSIINFKSHLYYVNAIIVSYGNKLNIFYILCSTNVTMMACTKNTLTCCDLSNIIQVQHPGLPQLRSTFYPKTYLWMWIKRMILYHVSWKQQLIIPTRYRGGVRFWGLTLTYREKCNRTTQPHAILFYVISLWKTAGVHTILDL